MQGSCWPLPARGSCLSPVSFPVLLLSRFPSRLTQAQEQQQRWRQRGLGSAARGGPVRHRPRPVSCPHSRSVPLPPGSAWPPGAGREGGSTRVPARGRPLFISRPHLRPALSDTCVPRPGTHVVGPSTEPGRAGGEGRPPEPMSQNTPGQETPETAVALPAPGRGVTAQVLGRGLRSLSSSQTESDVLFSVTTACSEFIRNHGLTRSTSKFHSQCLYPGTHAFITVPCNYIIFTSSIIP